jgi:signal transduction histidine kinase
MSTQLDGGMALSGPACGRGFGRRALSGLTPQVFAIVAALLLTRMLGTNIKGIIAESHGHRLGVWFMDLFTGFAMLVVMAVPMLIGITATANLGPRRGSKRVAALTGAVVLFSCVGLLLRLTIQDWLGAGVGWKYATGWLYYLWPRYALLCGMLTIAAEFYRREVASVEAMQRAELERAALELEMAEARLQVLQAQIEPHFLFNTLANVRRLYDKAHGAGRTMLDNLMRYLEVALPRMREHTTILEHDSELVEAFLRVQQIRMGQRLAFSVDIPASLRAHPVPPMMLLTLVENAIKHGLNPSLQGGLIRVGARRDGEQLILSVADTGVGFAPGSGAGTGLANIRARLAAQFGDQAALGLENNELGGVTATLVMPLAGEVQAK